MTTLAAAAGIALILLVLWEMGDARVAPQSTWWERIWCHSGAIVWAGMIGLYYMAYAA